MNRTHNRTGRRGLTTLVAVLSLVASTAQGAATDLSNGVPVTGLSGAANTERLYKIEVPPGQDELAISIAGGTGDVDLYVRRSSAPTVTSYDYRPFKLGNEELVTVEKPAGGTWYVLLRGYFNYAGVTLKATYTGPVPTTVLENGVSVGKLYGAAGSRQYFSIEVPAGYTELEIEMSGGTGDADLYVRKGAVPTETKYDYRPYLAGNRETVTVKDLAAGTWHIMIMGRKAYEEVTLVATFAGGARVLENDVPVTGLADRADGERFYRIEVPAGQTSLEIKISGTVGDADLYVKFKSQPTTSDYDYRPFMVGSNESVTVANPAAGTWYIMVRGYSAYSGVTLRATYGQVTTLKDGVPIPNLSGEAGSEKFFRIDVPNGQAQLVFKISGGSGNADMYVRRGATPTTVTWDHRPMKPDNTETVSIDNPPGGAWYVMLKGTTAYRGLTIEARYVAPSTVIVLTNSVAVTGIAGTAGQELFFKIEVPAGQEKIEIRTFGGAGDADLYVKRGAAPTTSDYDFRPYLIGNEEAVDVRNPAAGTWFIMVRGYRAFSGITLVATYTRPQDVVTPLQNGVPVRGLAGTAGSTKFFSIEVPAGQDFLTIELAGGTGNADLYIRQGDKPMTTTYDHRTNESRSDEKVEIANPAAATWHILVYGRTAYAGATLTATFGVKPRANDFASDPHCVALWQFESQALTKDSIGSNRLGNYGVSTQTADVREGTGCADFRAGQRDWMGIDDADLSVDFPTRNGDKDVEISVCFWMKPRSFVYGGTLISKYQAMSQRRSWQLGLKGFVDGYVQVELGIGLGNNSKRYDLDAAGQKLAKNRWYHVAFTYRDKDQQFRVRIWDADADKLVYDHSDKATSALAVTRAPLILGALGTLSDFYDGLLDEMVVFNDVLTTDEIDLIRQGRYGTTR